VVGRLGDQIDDLFRSSLSKNIKEADRRVKSLKTKLTKVLENPATYDPVYKACQRIFHRTDGLVLTRDNPVRRTIRHKAFRRFLHGCPPRKKTDTSIGDAINWEWMIHCANSSNAELVIVTRDSDYGVHFENRAYINDHLKQEFSERVSKKRKVLLYSKLSDALKHFEVPVTQQEEDAESELLTEPARVVVLPKVERQPHRLLELIRALQISAIDTVNEPSDYDA
jgi:hypothetical protein